MDFPTVVSFATRGNGYSAELVQRLAASCAKYDLPFYFRTLDSLGKWERNCSMKPALILEAWQLCGPHVLWVDADAEFVRAPDPAMFDGCDVAVHKNPKGRIISGTCYFGARANSILRCWAKACEDDRDTWDQKHLEKLINQQHYNYDVRYLPREYCMVFDRFTVKNPVIVHTQASRRLKHGTR